MYYLSGSGTSQPQLPNLFCYIFSCIRICKILFNLRLITKTAFEATVRIK